MIVDGKIFIVDYDLMLVRN